MLKMIPYTCQQVLNLNHFSLYILHTNITNFRGCLVEHKTTTVLENGDALIFPLKFYFKEHIIIQEYAVPRRLFSDPKMCDLE